ncbi:MAG: DUF5915 domain-containing protein [Candidatus Peribacteria bacterium]|nr:DUF5915 domain-containing protein [Candidatus Peribacteria bacterium]
MQEARKEAGYEVDDRISVEMSEDKSEESQKIEVKEVLGKFRKYIENETLSKIVDNLENVDLEKDVEVEELRVKIRLKK